MWLTCLFLSEITLAKEASPPSFSLSEASNTDISSTIKYYQFPQGSVPTNGEDIEPWISRLPPHQSTHAFGDRYVAVFNIYNDTSIHEWFVYPYGSVIETVAIHTFGDQVVDIKQTGYNHDNSINFHYGNVISIPKYGTRIVVIVFESDFFFAPIKIVISPENESSRGLELENLVLLLSMGICLSLSLYNFFVCLSGGKRMYLYYALATLCYLWGFAHLFGVIEFLLRDQYPQFLMPPYLLGVVFSSLFTIEFLNLKQQYPRLSKLLYGVALFCLITTVPAYYAPGWGNLLVSVATGAILSVGLVAGFLSWRRGYVPARYYVFAYIVVVATHMIGYLLNQGMLPGLDMNIFLMGLVGITVHSLLLALALAYRVQLIDQENSALASQLEQKVERRTEAVMNANTTLEHLIGELKEADNAKNRFLANMSHEIRTPLTSVIGYADGLLLGDIDQKEQNRVLRIISDNGNYLLNVINDVLDITKIEANKLDFECISVPLLQIMAQIESDVGKRARDKGLSFRVDYSYPLPDKINTDPTRLKQILFNLTNNAIKFTPEGYVGLTVSAKDNQLIIAIRDTGIGLDKKQQELLFSPFTQADSSINRRFGGSGLGLSISKHLAHGIDGDIKLESNLGEGSEFSLIINLNLPSDTNWIESDEDIWHRDENMPREAMPLFSNAKVLLADDHTSNRELVELLLKKMGISVTTVEDGQQAIDVVKSQTFDLILMDIHMPKKDGVGAFKEIRALGFTLPVIALTANNMAHEVQRYQEQGFCDHLSKPISRQQFVEKLKHYLSKKEETTPSTPSFDMTELIREYAEELMVHMENIEGYWQQHDLDSLRECAHRIKGSAGSFGFEKLGSMFADIEQKIKSEESETLPETVIRALKYGQLCARLPGIDLGNAITDHGNDISAFHTSLQKHLPDLINTLAIVSAAIATHNTSTAQIELSKLTTKAVNLSLIQTSELCAKLSTLLLESVPTIDECNRVIAAISTQLNELQQYLADHPLPNDGATSG